MSATMGRMMPSYNRWRPSLPARRVLSPPGRTSPPGTPLRPPPPPERASRIFPMEGGVCTLALYVNEKCPRKRRLWNTAIRPRKTTAPSPATSPIRIAKRLKAKRPTGFLRVTSFATASSGLRSASIYVSQVKKLTSCSRPLTAELIVAHQPAMRGTNLACCVVWPCSPQTRTPHIHLKLSRFQLPTFGKDLAEE